MKKMIFTMAVMTALVFSQGASAQIELEHTFGEERTWYEGGINYYARYTSSAEDNTRTVEVRLYNEDYSLCKIIPPIILPEYYWVHQLSLFSKNVFTNDDKITFFIYSTSSSLPNAQKYGLKLYDENGTVVKDFGYGSEFSYSIHVTSDNKYRLYVTRNSIPFSKAEIYSLPGTGTATGLKSAQVENTKQLPYPNPANTVITLPYKLEQGETSVMNIYNISGQLIDTKQIDYVFDRILLNVSGYAKGVYFYEVKGVSSKFVVE